MNPESTLRKMRAICLKLPEVTETVTFGHPTYKAGKKTFAVLDKYKGEYAIAFKASIADQTALVMDPRFYISPYIGQHGWTSMKLSDDIDWYEVCHLLTMSYRLVALKRMIKKLGGS